MSCSICIENFNKSNRCEVTCDFCHESACKTCVREGILNTSSEASCMFCKNQFNTLFLTINLNKNWVHTTYKTHLEQILIERQIAQLPQTQEKAETTKKIRQLEIINKELNKEKENYRKKLAEIKNRIRKNRVQILELSNSAEPEEKNFTIKCTNLSCTGFLDSKYECGICDNKVCKDCMEMFEENHECDPNKVENVKFIKKDTKPCPGCGTFIHKIYGCDQMWCPECKVAFSWKNGAIEKGNIHNPEYHRWIRENHETIPMPREENRCNQLPSLAFIQINLRKIFASDNIIREINSYHQGVNHIIHLDNIYIEEIRNIDTTLEKSRIGYLLGDFDKDTWRHQLQQLDKAQKKATDVINVYRLIRDILTPIIWSIAERFHECYSRETHIEFIEDNILKINNLRKFANEAFKQIGSQYNREYQYILSDWSVISSSTLKTWLRQGGSQSVYFRNLL